jgi:hypothetical protein
MRGSPVRLKRNDDLQIQSILEMADRMIVLSDQGLMVCVDDGCVLLNGMLRECAYRLRDAAELEQGVHRTRGDGEDAGKRRLPGGSPHENGKSEIDE